MGGTAGRGRTAKRVVALIYRHFLAHPDEAESDFVIATDPPWRRVADYVAGMTDGFALATAERLESGITAGLRNGGERLNLTRFALKTGSGRRNFWSVMLFS